MKNDSNPDTAFLPPPSRLRLPRIESPPATILAHLITHFPHVPPHVWRERVARCLVTCDDGTVLRKDSPYRHGITIFYRREVPSEPDPVEEEVILHRDGEILVADKPHGMVVTPAGNHLDRSLLVRLQRSTGLDSVAPAHRLDRDTAGVVLFTVQPDARKHYHRLFAEGTIEREYLAVAHLVDPPDRKQWLMENRIEEGDPWFRRQIVEGAPNAITVIELLDAREGTGLFRIVPKTGRKHQIRVHMATIGFPIVSDALYPSVKETQKGDPPLQLLAKRLSFVDPLSGKSRTFASARELRW